MTMTTVSLNQTATVELEKFFHLTTKLGRRLEMFSDYLDENWHQLMQDKEAYRLFCINSCGQFIRHIDSSIPGASGYGQISWVADYHKEYGQLPIEWFLDIEGNLDSKLYNDYQTTGNIVAAWKCTPAGGDSGGDDD